VEAKKDAGQSRTKWQPDARQRRIVELLINPDDKRTKLQKLEEVGVRKSTFYDWMKDSRFLDYLNSQRDKYTDSEIAEVWKALVTKAKRGDISAIKLFFEMKGMYLEKKKFELTGKNGGPIQTEAAVSFYIPDNGRGDNDG
jgi:hypothetical protein